MAPPIINPEIIGCGIVFVGLQPQLLIVLLVNLDFLFFIIFMMSKPSKVYVTPNIVKKIICSTPIFCYFCIVDIRSNSRDRGNEPKSKQQSFCHHQFQPISELDFF